MGQQQSSEAQAAGTAEAAVPNPEEEVTWWCKLLIKTIAGVAGIIGFITGIFTCISLSLCVLAGILQMLLAVLILVFELPFCCQFIKIIEPITRFSEQRTFMQKAFIYGGGAIVPFVMCVGLTTLIGCGAMFATGVFYGLLALGRKADRSTMLARAAADQPEQQQQHPQMTPPPPYKPDDRTAIVMQEQLPAMK